MSEFKPFTSGQLKALIKDKSGHDVEIIAANPVVLGSVSLVPLGTVGVMYVFLNDDGEKCAVGVPFSLVHTEVLDEAA
jgi:hypothetical protein